MTEEDVLSMEAMHTASTLQDYSFDSGYCSTPNKLPHATYSDLHLQAEPLILGALKEEPAETSTNDPFICDVVKQELFSPLTNRRVAIEHNAPGSSIKLEEWDSCIDDAFGENLFSLDVDFASPQSEKKQQTRRSWHTPSSRLPTEGGRLKKRLLFSPDECTQARKSTAKFVRLSPIKPLHIDQIAVRENFTCSRGKETVSRDASARSTQDALKVARRRFREILHESVEQTRAEYQVRKKNDASRCGAPVERETTASDGTAKSRWTSKGSQRKKYKPEVLSPLARNADDNKSAKSLLLSQSSLQYCKIQPKPTVWTLHRL